VSRRNRFSLLVVRDDGTRLLQIDIPRRLVLIGATCAALTCVVVLAMAVDWANVRRISRDLRPYMDRIAEQQATLDGINHKIRELRSEVAGWRDVHARMLDAFGPERAGGAGEKGMGGPATPAERSPSGATPRDELTRLADSVAQESHSLQVLDRVLVRAARLIAVLPSRWPVRGAVNSEFGNRTSPWNSGKEFHSGLDIRAERGTPVRAPAVGTVSYAGWHAEYGHTVIVDHANDLKSIYGHLSKISVELGQRVEVGTELGLTGNSGRSSGPHLHYEILVKGQPVNPRSYLWE
jgi:murein DD-endopeptidase MepM/ murein hydrolase activator NlpD